MADITAVVKAVEASLASLADEFKQVKTLWGAVKMVPHVVEAVEVAVVTVGPLTGPEKKQVAVIVLDDLVDIPLLPDSVERVIIGWAVDLVVHVANGWLARWLKLGLFQNK